VSAEAAKIVLEWTLSPDEFRDYSRMVHEALGVELVESCVECQRALSAHINRAHGSVRDRMIANGLPVPPETTNQDAIDQLTGKRTCDE